jgi:hypothetical protein
LDGLAQQGFQGLFYVHGVKFETAGHLDRDAKIYCFTDIADIESEGLPREAGCLVTKQSVLVKDTDIYENEKLFKDLVIFSDNNQHYLEEPGIDLGKYYD